MKICVTATGKDLESKLDARFGRAENFIIVDSDTMYFEVIDNSLNVASGGAGIKSGQVVIDKGINVLITGNVGPNAMNVLTAGGVKIYKGSNKSVKENIEDCKNGLLSEINNPVDQHFGLGGGKR